MIFKLAKKDFRLFLADRKALILSFLVPICLVTLFAFAFGGVGQKPNEPRPTQLLVGDDDHSAASKQLIARLDSLKELDVSVTTRDSAIAAVRKGDEAAVLLIAKGYADSLQQGGDLPLEFDYDKGREAEVGILQGALTGRLMGILGGTKLEKDVVSQFRKSHPELQEASLAQAEKEIKNQFNIQPVEGESHAFLKHKALVAQKENSPGLIHAVAGTSVMMLLFAVVGMGASLLEEKEQGTLRKLLYAPIHANAVLAGKMIYVMLVSMIQLCVMFLYDWLAFGLEIWRHLPALGLMIIATSFACSSFGVFLAAVAKSRQQVQGMATLIVLVMSCVGGSMIPSFVMPVFMQKMAVFCVNYWSIQGFYDIFWRSLPFSDTQFLNRALVLFIIGTVMNLAAFRLYKKNIIQLS